MALPGLEDAESYLVAGVGNPLLDHVSYFHPASPATWLLARRAFPAALMRQPVALLPRWERYAEDTIARIRAFSCALGLLLLASHAITRIGDASGLTALAAQARRPGWFFAGLLLVAAAAPILGRLDRDRLSNALDERPLGLPPTRYRVPYGIRWILFGLLILHAATVGSASHDLVPYERLTPIEAFWLPIAPRLCQAGTMGLACALLAGYRPPLLSLLALIAPLLLLATYLPGESFFAWWSFWLVVVVAAFRVLARPDREADGPITSSYRLFTEVPPGVAIRRLIVLLGCSTGLMVAGILNTAIWIGTVLGSAVMLWAAARRRRLQASRRARPLR